MSYTVTQECRELKFFNWSNRTRVQSNQSNILSDQIKSSHSKYCDDIIHTFHISEPHYSFKSRKLRMFWSCLLRYCFGKSSSYLYWFQSIFSSADIIKSIENCFFLCFFHRELNSFRYCFEKTNPAFYCSIQQCTKSICIIADTIKSDKLRKLSDFCHYDVEWSAKNCIEIKLE